MPLAPYACSNCGFWQRWFAVPPQCPVCVDVRNGLPEDGWDFVGAEEVDARLACSWSEVAPGVVEFAAAPRFGLDSRGWLLLREEGNVAFEGAPWYSDAALDHVESLGGVAVASASHPHGYGALWRLQDRFGPEVVVHKDDLAWTKAFRVTHPFDDVLELAPGLTLHHTGGHFAGHAVLHDRERKALFSGDALKFDRDAAGRATAVSTHMAYHARIPMSHGDVRRYRQVMAPLDFARVFTPFEHVRDATTRDALALFDAQLAGKPFFGPVPVRHDEAPA